MNRFAKLAERRALDNEPVIELLNERIKALVKQNSDLQASNNRLLFVNRDLQAELLRMAAQLNGTEAVAKALGDQRIGVHVPVVPFGLPSNGGHRIVEPSQPQYDDETGLLQGSHAAEHGII